MKISKKLIVRLVLAIMCMTGISLGENYIIVNKKNVQFKFARFDRRTDTFVANFFHNWEDETFEVFDQVKDSRTIAIDLGAWIGVTTIWLSKNFYHVVAVEPDIVSLKCLRNNLKASECSNVSICNRPAASTNENVIFGPLGTDLNESISSIKISPDKQLDYVVQGITFNQILEDYIYAHEALKSRTISFIKCDIEGGEENILEDMLNFAYRNNVKIYLSFHLSWWKSKNINEFAHLFKLFKTNCPIPDVVQYIQKNPFGSVFFEPIDAA